MNSIQPPSLQRSGQITVQPIIRAGLPRIIGEKIYGDQVKDNQLIGIAGELIFSLYLSGLNITHKLNRNWLNDAPVPQFDLMIYDWRIDVKTFPEKNWDLMIKVDEFNNVKKVIDKYCFIQLLDEITARYWIFDKSDVGQWETKTGQFGMNYFKPIKDIQ